MKKGLIYLLIFLIFINLSLATITIDSFDKSKYNIGEKINVRGSVVYKENVEGALKLNLNCGSETLPVYFSLINLNAGKEHDFNLEIPARERLVGKCNFLLSVEGAVEEFEKSSDTFDISDELDVDVSLNVLLINPGGTIVISGKALELDGDIVQGGGANVIFDEIEEKLVNLQDGKFVYDWVLQNDIKSGNHKVKFFVEDINGNKGEDFASFRVNAIPSLLELNLDDSYSPGSSILGSVFVYDQAGDLIEERINIEVYDANQVLQYTLIASDKGEFSLDLDDYSIPGNWKMVAKSFDLQIDDYFYVIEIRKIDLNFQENFVFVKNIGNVEYTEPIEILLNGESDVTLIKETSLAPNQTVIFDLSKEVDYAGSYEVSVRGFPEISGSVVLEGRSFRSGSFLGWTALTFVFVFFIYMVTRKGKKFINSGKKDIKKIREKGKTILERNATNEDKIRQKDIDYLVGKVRGNKPIKNSSESQNMFKIFE